MLVGAPYPTQNVSLFWAMFGGKPDAQDQKQGKVGFLHVSHTTAPASGAAAHALHNSLGLHSSSKRWCEWLPGVVLGPGTLEKGGCGLSRPGWQFMV